MRWKRDVGCADCKWDYFNPFDNQPLRFLWWLDDAAHRRHLRMGYGPLRWICELLDRQLRAAPLPDAAPAGEIADARE